MQPHWNGRGRRHGVARALAGGAALATLVAPAAAQQTAPDGAVEQTVREAVRAASPDPILLLSVAAVGGFVGALLANVVWNARQDSSRTSQPGPQVGGAPGAGGPAPGAGSQGPGGRPQQSGQGTRQDQPPAQDPGGQQGGSGPLGESDPDRDQQR